MNSVNHVNYVTAVSRSKSKRDLLIIHLEMKEKIKCIKAHLAKDVRLWLLGAALKLETGVQMKVCCRRLEIAIFEEVKCAPMNWPQRARARPEWKCCLFHTLNMCITDIVMGVSRAAQHFVQFGEGWDEVCRISKDKGSGGLRELTDHWAWVSPALLASPERWACATVSSLCHTWRRQTWRTWLTVRSEHTVDEIWYFLAVFVVNTLQERLMQAWIMVKKMDL